MSRGTSNCGDEVVVLSGKYAGQQGKVIKITVKMYQLQLRTREVSLLKMLEDFAAK